MSISSRFADQRISWPGTFPQFGSQTQMGCVMGTPAYMSPDQLEGKSNIGEEADCWAMAAVIYEAATGRKAFKGAYAELVYQIGKEHPIPIGVLRSDAPAAFADAIAAARDEAQRLGTTNVHFEVRDITQLQQPERYDLVTAFDVIHDQKAPGRASIGGSSNKAGVGSRPATGLPSAPCEKTVRPNSPPQITSVSSNRPRRLRSITSAADGWSVSRHWFGNCLVMAMCWSQPRWNN